MRTALKTCTLLILACYAQFGFGQGTLQYSQALLLTSQSGPQTVPAGKVWKITAQRQGGGVRYGDHSNSFNVTWTASNPNPCNGATSGTSNVRYLGLTRCPDFNNLLVVNGVRVKEKEPGQMWLPAGTTLSVAESPCRNTLSPNIGAGNPYYVLDQTNTSGNQAYYGCDGPINLGTVPNSLLVTVIEFNILP